MTGTVVIDGEPIETTPEHPFFSVDRGFVPAEDLREGELVATASGVPGEVESVSWDGGPAEMWNLTVEVDHTFFVGERGVWVHNDCKQGADFIVGDGGVTIPTDPDTLKAALSKMNDVSGKGPHQKYTGTQGGRPIRVQIHRGHASDPLYTGPANPLHQVDHLHVDRRAKGITGKWQHDLTVGMPWPFN